MTEPLATDWKTNQSFYISKNRIVWWRFHQFLIGSFATQLLSPFHQYGEQASITPCVLKSTAKFLKLFYKNGHNSGTKSQKVVPNVGNEPCLPGLQTGGWPKLGLYAKNRIFGPKTKISGPKKNINFLTLTMFWPGPEKVVQRKKLPFPK